MSNKELINYLMKVIHTFSNEYYDLDKFNYDFQLDNDVLDCQFKLYIVLLINDTENRDFNKRFDEFLESYNKLSIDKQEFIKRDFINILKSQEENEKKKEKIL